MCMGTMYVKYRQVFYKRILITFSMDTNEVSHATFHCFFLSFQCCYWSLVNTYFEFFTRIYMCCFDESEVVISTKNPYHLIKIFARIIALFCYGAFYFWYILSWFSWGFLQKTIITNIGYFKKQLSVIWLPNLLL